MGSLVFEKNTQNLAVSGEARIGIAGDFFRISASVSPVTVTLLKQNRVVGNMSNFVAGDYVKDLDFDGVVIKNGAVAQDISYQIAGGGAGSDSVIGTVDVKGLVDVNLKGAVFDSANSFVSQSLLVANVPQMILSPAVNVNGLNLISWQAISANSVGISATVLIAKNAPPVSVVDGIVVHCLVDSVGSVSASYAMSGSIKSPLFIPAGLGLYALATVNETGAFRSALIDVL